MPPIRVASRSDLADGQRVLIEHNGAEVCVFSHNGQVLAYENRCVHQGGPVGEGVIVGKVECVLDDQQRLLSERFSETEIHLVCPWHGWEFEITSGRSATNPRLGLRKYEVTVQGEDVYLADGMSHG